MKGPKPQPISDRFWRFVTFEPNTGCWLWTGNTTKFGYGQIKVGSMRDGTRRPEMAHRVSYEMHKGSTEGLCVLHTCDVPQCVNPSHLWLGTKSDNSKDAHKKGRAFRKELTTHCLDGHAYTPENTYISKSDGSRVCRTCARKSSLKSYHKKKECV